MHIKTRSINAIVLSIALVAVAGLILYGLHPFQFFTDKSGWYARQALVQYSLSHEDRASQLANTALLLNPNNADAQFLQLMILASQGEHINTSSIIPLIVDRGSSLTPWILYYFVILKIWSCQNDEALNLTMQGLNTFPKNSRLNLLGGILLIKKGEYDGARALLKEGQRKSAADTSPAVSGDAHDYLSIVLSFIPEKNSTSPSKEKFNRNDVHRMVQYITACN